MAEENKVSTEDRIQYLLSFLNEHGRHATSAAELQELLKAVFDIGLASKMIRAILKNDPQSVGRRDWSRESANTKHQMYSRKQAKPRAPKKDWVNPDKQEVKAEAKEFPPMPGCGCCSTVDPILEHLPIDTLRELGVVSIEITPDEAFITYRVK